MTSYNSLDKKLQSLSWGLFLIMAGGLLIVPQNLLPKGIWLIGVGIIMLLLNVVRYFNNIRVSKFTTILGIIAVLSGVFSFYGFNLPVLPTLVILVGVSILIDSVKKI